MKTSLWSYCILFFELYSLLCLSNFSKLSASFFPESVQFTLYCMLPMRQCGISSHKKVGNLWPCTLHEGLKSSLHFFQQRQQITIVLLKPQRRIWVRWKAKLHLLRVDLHKTYYDFYIRKCLSLPQKTMIKELLLYRNPLKASISLARHISSQLLSCNQDESGFLNLLLRPTPPVNKNINSWCSISFLALF